MRSDSQFPVRDAIHAVTGPLGWSLALMAKAAGCSVATVQNDLRERGGVTGAFPNRPTTAGEIYAATFMLWLKDGFLNDVVQGVAEELLEVPRLQAMVNGMGQAFRALCEPMIAPEDVPYMNLLSAIFGFSLRVRGVVPSPWVMYTDGVKRGEFPAPQSANGVLAAMSQLYRAQIDRSEISLPGMSGVRDGVDAALSTLEERSRKVLILLYGLESGTQPSSPQAVATRLSLSRIRIHQIEAKALRLLRGGRGRAASSKV